MELPDPHLLQAWEWGEFKGRHGWQPTRYLWVDPETDQPRAAASLLRRRLSRGSFGVMYVPKGPVLDYSDSAALDRILGRLETVAQQKRAFFVKIDPDVIPDTAVGKQTLDTLRRRGWRRSEEQIQFRNTILLDLTPSLNDLLKGMKSKWRYNVRLAQRRGVSVRCATREELPLLYRMYEETARRGDFVIRPKAYHDDAWGSFIDAGLAQPLIAEAAPVGSSDPRTDGEPVAMVIVYRFGKRAYYMYGASRSVHRDKMPNNLLQWEAMKWAKKRGCTVYDFWGAPDVPDESDPLWGVYRFKRGFGGEFVEHIGAWDYPSSHLGYWLYTVAMPRVLAAMRWLHWQRTTENPWALTVGGRIPSAPWRLTCRPGLRVTG
ncbi:MAG: peptidoglycan bridge formation glycyltransferase FemA/FemB family protein [Anaerolineae bacterium]|jgi:lipid II:glycine glycyltransferase (peptidoglycan interpeptide bridge formation enzyme)